MKKAVLVMCWGCFWSTCVIGMPNRDRPIASSSNNSSQRVKVLDEEGSLDEEGDLISIANKLGALEVPGLSRDSKYPVDGVEYLQLILDQNQMRLSAKWEELSVKEKYLNDESERNPFVRAKQREIDSRDSIIAEQKNSLEQSRAIITGLEEKNKINQQEIGSLDSIIAEKEEDLKQSRAIIAGLEEKNKINQQEIGNRDLVIAEKEEDLKQSRETISSLEEKDRVNQKTISEQNQVISQQSEDLSRKDEEVYFLKEKTDVLEKEIQEKEQQIQIRDQRLGLVTDERDKYKMKSRSYEANFKLIKDAVDLYAASWAGEGDFKERYDSAKSISDKIAVVMAHLIEHNAKKGGVLQRKETVLGSCSRIRQEDLTSNTVVDATRHDFLLMSERGDDFFPIGDKYNYRGGVKENLPDGEGEITDKNEVMKISGTFEKGFFNIAKPLSFKGSGFVCEFKFPAEIKEKYHNLISFIDISEMQCSFGVGTLILKQPGKEMVSFVFNENYVYVGGLNDCDLPSGRGVKFCKDGEIQDGEFLDGYFMGEGDVNPAKRKRVQ